MWEKFYPQRHGRFLAWSHDALYSGCDLTAPDVICNQILTILFGRMVMGWVP